MQRIVTRRFALRVSRAVLLGGLAARALLAEPQPNMEAALRWLREALPSREKASSDKGGPRTEAPIEDHTR